MAYQLKSKAGQPIKKDGAPVFGSDCVGVKIEQLDDANLTFVAIASTEDEDRDKDIIRVSGWDLKNFKKNPVVPWSHNYWDLPVAKATRVWVDSVNKRLLFKPKFDKNDDFSVKIFQKYANGFLTSFSVGFRGIEFNERDPNNWWGGKEFLKQELLEVSAVAVPANPNANVNLSYEGSEFVKSMLDVGYPEFFARRSDEWLFYPVRDPSQFSNPKQVPIENNQGAYVIFGKAIDEDHPEKDAEVVVGYSFDPEQFDKDLAVDFVKENGEKVVKSFYYHVQYDDEKGIFVEPVIQDVELTYFDGVKPFNWGDPNSVHNYTYRVYSGKNSISIENDNTEGKKPDDSILDTKSDDDAGDDKPDDGTGSVESAGVTEPSDNETQKDVNNDINIISEKIEKIISVVESLSKSMNTVMEKLVDKQENICNNNTDPEFVCELEDEKQQDQVDNGNESEDLEIVDTEKKDPVDDKKSNSEDEDTIEIDEAELKNVVGEIGKSVVGDITVSLKKQLTDAIVNSGKID
jgi:HK97 family phage prohead protease